MNPGRRRTASADHGSHRAARLRPVARRPSRNAWRSIAATPRTRAIRAASPRPTRARPNACAPNSRQRSNVSNALPSSPPRKPPRSKRRRASASIVTVPNSWRSNLQARSPLGKAAISRRPRTSRACLRARRASAPQPAARRSAIGTSRRGCRDRRGTRGDARRRCVRCRTRGDAARAADSRRARTHAEGARCPNGRSANAKVRRSDRVRSARAGSSIFRRRSWIAALPRKPASRPIRRNPSKPRRPRAYRFSSSTRRCRRKRVRNSYVPPVASYCAPSIPSANAPPSSRVGVRAPKSRWTRTRAATSISSPRDWTNSSPAPSARSHRCPKRSNSRERILERFRRAHPGAEVDVAVFSDGRANVPLGGDAMLAAALGRRRRARTRRARERTMPPHRITIFGPREPHVRESRRVRSASVDARTRIARPRPILPAVGGCCKNSFKVLYNIRTLPCRCRTATVGSADRGMRFRERTTNTWQSKKATRKKVERQKSSPRVRKKSTVKKSAKTRRRPSPRRPPPQEGREEICTAQEDHAKKSAKKTSSPQEDDGEKAAPPRKRPARRKSFAKPQAGKKLLPAARRPPQPNSRFFAKRTIASRAMHDSPFFFMYLDTLPELSYAKLIRSKARGVPIREGTRAAAIAWMADGTIYPSGTIVRLRRRRKREAAAAPRRRTGTDDSAVDLLLRRRPRDPRSDAPLGLRRRPVGAALSTNARRYRPR